GGVGEGEDQPRERGVLHPRPGHGDDLAREEEPVVPVLAQARERARVQLQQRSRHSAPSTSRASGSSARSTAASSSGDRRSRRDASHAVRRRRTERSARTPFGVSASLIRRASSAARVRRTSPAFSFRSRYRVIAGAETPSREASSRTPSSGYARIWASSAAWPPVIPSACAS